MQRSLSELLRFETKDPGLADVSLTTVELSRLRRKLGSALLVRHIPELRWVHDDSIARAAEISRLIDDANDSSRES
jgi:ribosome-binding factor A